MAALPMMSAPAHANSREQAQELVSDLPRDLSGCLVIIDCSKLTIATASFLDELVKTVLAERNAAQLAFRDAPPRTRAHAERAAVNHQVAGRLSFEESPEPSFLQRVRRSRSEGRRRVG